MTEEPAFKFFFSKIKYGKGMTSNTPKLSKFTEYEFILHLSISHSVGHLTFVVFLLLH